jgi:hypothetical protein
VRHPAAGHLLEQPARGCRTSYGSLVGIVVGFSPSRAGRAAPAGAREPGAAPDPGIAWIPFADPLVRRWRNSEALHHFARVFFPVWLSTHVGVMATRSQYVEAAQSLGIGKHELFYRVVLPRFSCLRSSRDCGKGLAIAFILVVAAELTGASSGPRQPDLAVALTVSHDRMLVGTRAPGRARRARRFRLLAARALVGGIGTRRRPPSWRSGSCRSHLRRSPGSTPSTT